MYYQLVESQVLSTRVQPADGGVNLHRLTPAVELGGRLAVLVPVAKAEASNISIWLNHHSYVHCFGKFHTRDGPIRCLWPC